MKKIESIGRCLAGVNGMKEWTLGAAKIVNGGSPNNSFWRQVEEAFIAAAEVLDEQEDDQ